MGWYCGNAYDSSHIVGQKKPNSFGLSDMHGNVWEWCADWYDVYPTGDVTDPTGAGTGSGRVFRGGGWLNGGRYCRSAYRYDYFPSYGYDSLGFRVVLPPG